MARVAVTAHEIDYVLSSWLLDRIETIGYGACSQPNNSGDITMSNHASSILAATYLDSLFEQGCRKVPDYLGTVCSEILQGSAFNPLLAMRLLSMNVDEEMSYESEELAKACNVPVSWFNCSALDADINEVLPALGRMALIYLSSLRTAVLAECPLQGVKEEPLQAEGAFMEIMAHNGFGRVRSRA